METVEGEEAFRWGFGMERKEGDGERVAGCRRRGGRGASLPLPLAGARAPLSVQGLLLLLFPLPVQCGRCALTPRSLERG